MNENKYPANLTCAEALALVLDNVDYTRHACGVTDMVGACLPPVVIERARAALAREKAAKS